MSRIDFLPALGCGLAVWPGLFLLAGGAAKARDVRDAERIRRTVLARLLPDRVAPRPVWAAAAALELAVGALLVAGVLAPWPARAAAGLLGVATLVATWGVRRAPDAPCGCLGARDEAVSPRTAIRAGLLTALAAAGAAGGAGWTRLFERPAAVPVVLAAGFALALLSSELRAICLRRFVPLAPTVARLRRSDLWQDARRYVVAEEPSEHWRKGCWRYICYPASYDGVPATAVFALDLSAGHAVGVAFVDEEQRRVLGQMAGSL